MISGLKHFVRARVVNVAHGWEPKTRWLADWNTSAYPWKVCSCSWVRTKDAMISGLKLSRAISSYYCKSILWEPKTRWLADWNVRLSSLKVSSVEGVRTKDAMISGLKQITLPWLSYPNSWEPKTRWLADWNNGTAPRSYTVPAAWEPKTRWLADWNVLCAAVIAGFLGSGENQRRDD